MAEALLEFVDSRGLALRVDAENGVLRGVKLIGLESRNSRRYRPEALAAAVALYEGAKVNVNHPKDGPLSPRDYQDRLGVIRGVEFRAGEGLFGDLHFNPKHALAEQLAWDATHNPRNVGFSHNVLARLAREEDAVVVEEITRVQSVDLVADPAATDGLFEHADRGADTSPDRGANQQDFAAAPAAWDALSMAVLAVHRPDLLEEIRRQNAAAVCEQAAALSSDLHRERRLRGIACALSRCGVFPPSDEQGLQRLIGASLFETLLTVDDEARFAALVEERATALAVNRNELALPKSREQGVALRPSAPRIDSAGDFVRAICR